MNLTKTIAQAIKNEDKTYFFEDYTKQAKAVLKVLHKSGYVLVPKEPSAEMIKAGVLAINLGIVDAKVLAKEVYQQMIEADE